MSIFHRHHDRDHHENPPVHQPQPRVPFDGEMIRNPTVRIFTKAEENYSLSVRDGAVVLAPANPRDEFQHWYKDFRWSTQAKDAEGLPAFALVNKATGLAIKHSLGPSHPVRLIPFNPEYLDESILWTESHDTGEGFRCIRMVNNIQLNFDAFHGDKDHGGVHDGTAVVLWEWLKGPNQRWKIEPYYYQSSHYDSRASLERSIANIDAYLHKQLGGLTVGTSPIIWMDTRQKIFDYCAKELAKHHIQSGYYDRHSTQAYDNIVHITRYMG